MNRRAFLLLMAAVTTWITAGAAAANVNRRRTCGVVVKHRARERHAAEEQVFVVAWKPNLQPKRFWVSKSAYLNSRKHHLRRVDQGPVSVADILAGVSAAQLRRYSQYFCWSRVEMPIVEPNTSKKGRSINRRGMTVVGFAVFLSAYAVYGGLGTIALADDVAQLEGNLSKDTSPDMVQHDDRPPLIAAIVEGHAELVNALLRNGGDPNVMYERVSALMYAAAQGRCSDAIVGLLLARGANPNVPDTVTGATPLLRAAASGNDRCVVLLLQSGAHADVENAIHENAVWNATLGGNLATLDRFLSLGIDVNKSNIQGVTPLMVAASAGNVAIVKRLLSVHADECARDRRGRSARVMATDRGHTEVVRILSKCEPAVP